MTPQRLHRIPSLRRQRTSSSHTLPKIPEESTPSGESYLETLSEYVKSVETELVAPVHWDRGGIWKLKLSDFDLTIWLPKRSSTVRLYTTLMRCSLTDATTMRTALELNFRPSEARGCSLALDPSSLDAAGTMKISLCYCQEMQGLGDKRFQRLLCDFVKTAASLLQKLKATHKNENQPGDSGAPQVHRKPSLVLRRRKKIPPVWSTTPSPPPPATPDEDTTPTISNKRMDRIAPMDRSKTKPTPCRQPLDGSITKPKPPKSRQLQKKSSIKELIDRTMKIELVAAGNSRPTKTKKTRVMNRLRRMASLSRQSRSRRALFARSKTTGKLERSWILRRRTAGTV